METVDKNKVIIVHADCIPVKGYKRSCIYDLTRKKYYFIPNSLANVLLSYHGKPVNKLYFDYDNSPILDEYFNFLIEKEIIYLADEWEKDFFPVLNLEWKHPSKINSALIDVDSDTIYSPEIFRKVFDELGVMHLQIRLFGDYKADFLNQLLSSLKDTRLKSIELIAPFDDNYLSIASGYYMVNPKVLLVYFYGAAFIKNHSVAGDPKIIITTDKEETLSTEKSPNPKYFGVNIQSFTEAQKHHTFYNRKMFVDKNGQVKNSLFGTKCFGNIDSVDIHSIVDSKEFQEFWFAEKDKSSICRDCEFRYMCSDQRVPKKHENAWVHEIDCRYNPYLAKWAWENGFEPAGLTLNELYEHQTK